MQVSVRVFVCCLRRGTVAHEAPHLRVERVTFVGGRII